MYHGQPLMSGGLGRRTDPLAMQSSRARARMLLAERGSDGRRPESDSESDSDSDFPLRRSRGRSRTRFTERMPFTDRMGRSGRIFPDYDDIYPLDSASRRPRFRARSPSSYNYVYPDGNPSHGLSRRPHFRRRDLVSELDDESSVAPRRRSYRSDRCIEGLYTPSRRGRSRRNSLDGSSSTLWPRSRATSLNPYSPRHRSPSRSRHEHSHRYRRSSSGHHTHIRAPKIHDTHAPSIHIHTHTHHHHYEDPYANATQPLNVPHYPPGTPIGPLTAEELARAGHGPSVRLPHPMFGRTGVPPAGGTTFYPTADGRRAVAAPVVGWTGRIRRRGLGERLGGGYPGY